MNSGWMLPEEAFEYIEKNVEEHSVIIEFGSGEGSQRLADRFELWSIEHDPLWLHRSSSNYLYAEIVSNEASNEFGEKGWYNAECLAQLPKKAALLIVDGPPGSIGRRGLLHWLHELPEVRTILVDDVDREPERVLAERLHQFYDCEIEYFVSEQLKATGELRKFAVLHLQKGESD